MGFFEIRSNKNIAMGTLLARLKHFIPIVLLIYQSGSLTSGSTKPPRDTIAEGNMYQWFHKLRSPVTNKKSPYQINSANNFAEIAKLYASDAQVDDRFGVSVSASENIIAIGAYLEDGGPGDPLTDAGAVYVFERDLGESGNWGEVARLTASDAQSNDMFGNSIAVDGNTIIVGAVGEDGGPGDPLPETGAAYIFERDLGGPGNWGEAIKLTSSAAQTSDRFGASVDISSDTIVVGAWGVKADPPNITGAAFVFERDLGGPGNWGEAKILSASDAQDSDAFGASVSIDGDIIVVGAWGKFGELVDTSLITNSGGGFGNTGAAYIYERDKGGAENWGESAKLTASDAQDSDFFGLSVDNRGDIVIVGAAWEDGGPGDPLEDAGAAYVFERNRGWAQTTKLTAGDAQVMDFFGISVSIDGDSIVIGASGEDGGPGDPLLLAGAAYVFNRDPGWIQTGKLTASDGQEIDLFGSSVSLSGNLLVVGSTGEDGGPGDPLPGAGAAYVFQRLHKLYLPIILIE